jgi:hypothetical protein
MELTVRDAKRSVLAASSSVGRGQPVRAGPFLPVRGREGRDIDAAIRQRDQSCFSYHTKGIGEAMNHFPKVGDLERAHGVTWAELTRLEPRLDELLWEARAEGARCHRWTDVEPVFAPFKNALAELVGFLGSHRGHPLLGSVGAYQVAYWRLHHAVSGLLPRSADAEASASVKAGEAIGAADRDSSWSPSAAANIAAAHLPQPALSTKRVWKLISWATR